MILAIDTATRYASVALYGEMGILAEVTWRSANNHSVELVPTIAEMLKRQRLSISAISALAVAQGPGSFTGLRIGMSVAKGFCFGLDIPLVAVPTLEITAYATGNPGCPVWAVLEAGRGRICVATYRFEEGLPVPQGSLQVVRVEEWFPAISEPVLVAGEVSPELAEHLLRLPGAEDLAIVSLAGAVRRAGYLAELAWNKLQEGQADDPDRTEPLYIHLSQVGVP